MLLPIYLPVCCIARYIPMIISLEYVIYCCLNESEVQNSIGSVEFGSCTSVVDCVKGLSEFLTKEVKVSRYYNVGILSVVFCAMVVYSIWGDRSVRLWSWCNQQNSESCWVSILQPLPNHWPFSGKIGPPTVAPKIIHTAVMFSLCGLVLAKGRG